MGSDSQIKINSFVFFQIFVAARKGFVTPSSQWLQLPLKLQQKFTCCPVIWGHLCMVSFFSIDHMTHDGSMTKTQVTQPLNIGILHGPQGHSGSQILDPRAAHQMEGGINRYLSASESQDCDAAHHTSQVVQCPYPTLHGEFQQTGEN